MSQYTMREDLERELREVRERLRLIEGGHVAAAGNGRYWFAQHERVLRERQDLEERLEAAQRSICALEATREAQARELALLRPVVATACQQRRLTRTRQSYNALCNALGVPTGPPIIEWAKRWRERNEKIEELLREYLSCPAEWYDARVKYSPVQVDHYLRAEARAVLGMEREEEPYQPASVEREETR